MCMQLPSRVSCIEIYPYNLGTLFMYYAFEHTPITYLGTQKSVGAQALGVVDR